MKKNWKIFSSELYLSDFSFFLPSRLMQVVGRRETARTAINGGTIIRMEPIQRLPGLGLTVTVTALQSAIILMPTDG